MSTDTILRAADPLAARHHADDLDPRGALAARVRAGAIGAAPRPTRAGRAGLDGRRVALVGALAIVLAVALAVVLPGGRPTPPDARAALVSAAQRTAAATSGHIVWHMVYDRPGLDLTNDVRFDGDDFANVWTTHHRDGDRKTYTGASRVVGGRRYARDGHRAFVDRGPADPGEGRDETTARIKAADALADAARAAADVRSEPAADGDATRYTATVASADVPDVFRAPSKRTAPTVTIVAIADGDTLRWLQLRGPGEEVDVTFDGLGQPQGIVAP